MFSSPINAQFVHEAAKDESQVTTDKRVKTADIDAHAGQSADQPKGVTEKKMTTETAKEEIKDGKQIKVTPSKENSTPSLEEEREKDEL